MKFILLLSLILLPLSAYSQITFEKGYWINNNNQRIDCFIKNMDWLSNPTSFEYKLNQNDSVYKTSIESTKEFAIDHCTKYIRADVKIDRSSKNINQLSSKKEPTFIQEQLFLKVLVEGNATLFSYIDGNITRFFFQKNNGDIYQLVYKQYLASGINVVENNLFRNQLLKELSCTNIEFNQFRFLKYTENDLQKLFIDYNECSNSDYILYNSTDKKKLFHLSIQSGIAYGKIEVSNNSYYSSPYNLVFSNCFTYKFGIELESILPFNNNKWSIFTEPNFQYLHKEINSKKDGYATAEVDYKSIEIPLGLRHYFYLKNGNQIFTSLSVIADFSLNSAIIYRRINGSAIQSLDINTVNNLNLGVGYKFAEKYNLELRLYSNRQLLKDYMDWSGKYKAISIMFGYKIF